MKVLGVIPARLHSQRLAKKLLRNILGKPLIQWTWEAAQRASTLSDLVIACDDEELLTVCKKFSPRVYLTSPKHSSGTERIAEVIQGIPADIVVNIQADEPLIHRETIDGLVQLLQKEDYSLPMATVIKKIERTEEVTNPSVVKVVIDRHGYALYFSRATIPYLRDNDQDILRYKHLGIYAYREWFLEKFPKLIPGVLESAEKLEQLRVLEAGLRIKTIETNHETCGVDTAEDLIRVEELLRRNT